MGHYQIKQSHKMNSMHACACSVDGAFLKRFYACDYNRVTLECYLSVDPGLQHECGVKNFPHGRKPVSHVQATALWYFCGFTSHVQRQKRVYRDVPTMEFHKIVFHVLVSSVWSWNFAAFHGLAACPKK